MNNFWYHAVWASKKLKRGELWEGKAAIDSHMKNLLLDMIRWNTCSVKGWEYDTWYKARFLEK